MQMFEHLIRNGPYSEAKAATFMKELANALVFLHKQVYVTFILSTVHACS
jgi:serine/threonine protein kinase